jgi:2-polyprenyl-3-methyl-5-hydroxy-6-metoxy-1,4-benzoquinol methylase
MTAGRFQRRSYIQNEPTPFYPGFSLEYTGPSYQHREFLGRLLMTDRAYSMVITIPAFFTGLYQEQRTFQHMLISALPAGRLPDVGCGDGQFVHLVAQQGWQGTGIDSDSTAVESGRKKHGLNLIAGDFQTANFASGDFDVVTMCHVIEHLPDPVACLDKCRRLLKVGGRLVVTTPNLRSLGHQRFGRNWRGLEPPRHLHIFAPNTLAECARRAELTVVRTGSTAVNADYLAKASLAIEKAAAPASGAITRTRFRDMLGAAAFQYREHFALRRDPDLGEEAFLVAERGA